ncbi:hypothetical protein CROQUDRAFT_656996 [Cronartium quercuum f. sp. fusiforme G11]|uniref:BBC1/AIM3 cysteine proteinase-fold domain-containing protein n=1 Tax=Cronartium quercuum f. sp. fusiforme G11 TaxID=708437 RepID=A0A9P6NNN2_9BASI|nr:hypothetical protein CROQUDRAFT_656996 [Cronartium quercuum f. sp. fusiforme G11]
MPILPASVSKINGKVNSARKGLNASLDKAGEKSGVFKSKSSNSNSTSVPARAAPLAPPSLPQRSTLAPPPPPPRRLDSTRASSSSSFDRSHGPPPPISRKPSAASIQRPNGHSSYAPSEALQQREEENKPALSSSRGALMGTMIRPPPTRAPSATPARYGPPSPLPSSVDDIGEVNSAPTRYKPPLPTYAQPGLRKPNAIPFPPFSQFTESDKLAFFELLDEFFARKVPSQDSIESSNIPPPPISFHSRPLSSMNGNTKTSRMSSFRAAYPTTCSGSIFAAYFANYRQWSPDTDQWYTAPDPIPPPIQSSTDVKRMSCWSQTGNTRTQHNYVLFADLTQAWSTLTFNVSRPFPPQSAECRYRPTPGPANTTVLMACAEIYGPPLVRFAEQAEQSGRHVARGECWDMANEALKAVPSLAAHLPPPLTSINRTHGYLLYHGMATDRGTGEGEWLAGDVGQVRPGDIIEWNMVACNTVNPTLICTLGDPDHTAIIVNAHSSTISAQSPAPPSQLGQITVVEQSLKQLPVRRTYDLSTISRGSVWIYRPASVAELLGESRDSCDWPPKGNTYTA